MSFSIIPIDQIKYLNTSTHRNESKTTKVHLDGNSFQAGQNIKAAISKEKHFAKILSGR